MPADLARELHRRHRLHDAPRVDQVVRRRELLDAVEEERPLLGEEERLRADRRRTAPASDSTCEKSGLTVPLSVRLLRDAPAHVAAELRLAGRRSATAVADRAPARRSSAA